MFNKKNKIFIIIIVLIITVTLSAETTEKNFFKTGKEYFDTNQFEKAVKFFKLESNTTDSDNNKILSLYYMARSYEKLNKPVQAVKIYKTITEKYPDNYFAEHSLNRIKFLKPDTEIDYKKLSAEKKEDEFETQKSSADESVMIKRSYDYEDVLENKKIIVQKNIENEIKTEINEQYKHTTKYNLMDVNDDEELNFIKQKLLNQPVEYIIKKDDTLYNIAKKAYGEGKYFDVIAKYNGINDITNIYENQKIILPSIEFIKKGNIINGNSIKKLEFSEREQLFANVKKTNKQADKYFEIAREKYNKNHFLDSIENFKKYIETGNEDYKLEYAYFKIAEIYHLLSRYNEAIIAYMDFISKFKDSSEINKAYYNLANIFNEALGQKKLAEKYYNKILENSGNEKLIQTVKIKLTEMSVETVKNNYETVNWKFNNENLSELIPDSKKIVGDLNETQPNDLKSSLPIDKLKSVNENVYDTLSEHRTDSIKQIIPGEEQTSVNKVNDFDKKDYEYYIKQGYRHKSLGVYSESINMYKTAIKFYPNKPVAYNNLAFLYSELKVNLDEAVELAETAIKLDPQHKGYYLDTLGWLYYQLEEYEKARKILEESIFYNPTAIRKYHLAMTYKKFNMREQSLIEFQDALVLSTDNKLMEKIKNEIYILKN